MGFMKRKKRAPEFHAQADEQQALRAARHEKEKGEAPAVEPKKKRLSRQPQS
jgi:hypothetical protein